MTLASSGPMSMSDVLLEKGTTAVAGGNYSALDLATSGINSESASRPDGIAPHQGSEFYGYDHNAGGGGGGEFLTFFETVYDTSVATESLTDVMTEISTDVATAQVTVVETFTVLTLGQTFIFGTEGVTMGTTTRLTEITTQRLTSLGNTTVSTSRTTSRLTS